MADDAPLVICPDQGYHRLLHMRMRIQAAGGDPNMQRICSGCKSLKALDQMSTARGHIESTCKRCVAANTNRIYHARRRRGDVAIVSEAEAA